MNPPNPTPLAISNPNPKLFVLAGPAGSGKSTLCDRLVAERPEFSRVVTTTTRPPRGNEINGVHYHFFPPTEFRAKIDRGEFLEWQLVHAAAGGQDDRLYGTLTASIIDPLRAHKALVMNIDVQGVEALRKKRSTNPVLERAMFTVFIRIDMKRMRDRMSERNEKPEEIERRTATAAAELAEASKFDYIIDSRTRDEDFEELLKIVEECDLRVRTRYPLPLSA